MTIEQLTDLVENYAAEHIEELSAGYITQLHVSVTNFEKFIGTTATIYHLKPELMNAYLAWMKERGRSPSTCRSRRGSLMAIWSYAYEICLTDVRPRIKRVRAARRIPVAWTPAEIVQLYDAAGQLSGEWVGISRNSYLQSLIIGLYSTGLRLGDTLSIAWPQINEAGSVRLVVSKTGREVVRHLDPIAIRLLRENGAPQRPLCWPLWGNRESLYRVFRGLVQSTLPESRWGTTKWLRRSGATEVARQQGVDAARYFLDHTSDAVTRRHYLDPMRQQIDIIRPPSLGIGDDEHGNDEPGDA